MNVFTHTQGDLPGDEIGGLMEVQDQIRELGKVLDVLTAAEKYFYHKDMMNANLHMSGTVRHTPLYSTVADGKATVLQLIERLREDPEQTLVKGAHEWPKPNQ